MDGKLVGSRDFQRVVPLVMNWVYLSVVLSVQLKVSWKVEQMVALTVVS